MLKNIVMLMIIIICFTGCSPDPTPTPAPTSLYTILFNIFDKDTGLPLNDVTLDIIESDLNQTYASNSFEIDLEGGIYNIILSKSGFKAKGYVLNIVDNTTINVMLKTQEDPVNDYGDISGNLYDGVDPFTEIFYISTGSPKESSTIEIPGNPEGAFSSI